MLEGRRQFVFYCAIGLTGATLDFLLYCALVHWCRLHHQPANLISVSCGIANNFWLNALFNFRVRDRLWARFATFYAVGCFGIALSALMLYLGIDRLNMDKTLAKLATVALVVIVQYNLNRILSFRPKD
jgi:putative flippase GtrA